MSIDIITLSQFCSQHPPIMLSSLETLQKYWKATTFNNIAQKRIAQKRIAQRIGELCHVKA